MRFSIENGCSTLSPSGTDTCIKCGTHTNLTHDRATELKELIGKHAPSLTKLLTHKSPIIRSDKTIHNFVSLLPMKLILVPKCCSLNKL